MTKKIIIAALAVAIIGASLGLYLFNKPLDSTTGMKPDFSMSTVELISAFETNEELANTKYLDKVISVKGSVTKVERNNDKVTVYLDADSPMSSVIFQLEDGHSDIKIGQEVTLKGICTGYLMDVVLVRSVQV